MSSKHGERSGKRRKVSRKGVAAPTDPVQPVVTEDTADVPACNARASDDTPQQDAATTELSPVVATTFAQIGVADWLCRQTKAVGIGQPTGVQSSCIPPILAGKDTYGVAKTGSGKTATFAIPILQRLARDPYSVFAVVLTPTRELAFQIADQFAALGQPMGLRMATVVGGLDFTKQAVELAKRPHIIVATPGRLADHISGGAAAFSLARLKVVVYDEADRLLQNESYGPDLATIEAALPSSRQTLLFTATAIKPDCAFLSTLRPPVHEFKQKSTTATVASLKQEYLLMPSHVRHCYFIALVRELTSSGSKGSCIVFTSTCKSCAELALLLTELEIPCVALHSVMSQTDRLASLGKFRSNYVRVLVATDVASRGLDIAPVKVVLNFNVPKAVDDYIHRVGRTARAGRGGRAVTLMSEHDVELIHAIEDKVGVRMSQHEGLDEDEVLRTLSKVNVARRAVNQQMLEKDFGAKKRKQKLRKKAREEQERADMSA
eukprot:m.22519 g.22519  ORF g.22519 m.22519 type:complete len:492 (-) comp3998_c0_seq1:927-2402(-)